MSRIAATVESIGAMQRQSGLPELALIVAKAAAARQVDVTDAMELYSRYFAAAHPRRKFRETDAAIKANASKLRKIIEAADPALLERVIHIHGELRHGGGIRSLYDCMVDACRRSLHTGKHLSDAELARLCRTARYQ